MSDHLQELINVLIHVCIFAYLQKYVLYFCGVRTLSLKSLYGLSSVCNKTTQTTGGVGVAGGCPPTSKLGTFLLQSLALRMPI